MQYLTDDVRITGMEEVLAPAALIDELPVSPEASSLIFRLRREASAIIHGADTRRLLVIVGPCSIHDTAAALEYAERLATTANDLQDELCILMRVYFEKPRTTVGWKGLINDPGLDSSFDINGGLRTARKLLSDIANLGVGAGTEYLDPITPQYVGDLVCWGAIGARTTESQVHRQLASGLSCPIGFKNSTNGDIQVAVDAVNSAMHQHIFLSVTKAGHSAIFSTSGNDDCHVILRGGGGRTNYGHESIETTAGLLEKATVPVRMMVDASHANSNKDHERQMLVCDDLAEQMVGGEDRILGVMLESNLVAGRQNLSTDLTYGQSITDACIDWDDTVRCLEKLATAVTQRAAKV